MHLQLVAQGPAVLASAPTTGSQTTIITSGHVRHDMSTSARHSPISAIPLTVAGLVEAGKEDVSYDYSLEYGFGILDFLQIIQ